MCRMLAAHIVSRRSKKLLYKLIDLLVEASMKDPYLARLTSGDGRHCHGYGYVVVGKRGGSRAWRIVYERYDSYDEGVGAEDSCISNLVALKEASSRVIGLLDRLEEAYVIFHARRAGRSEPRGSLNSHPFHVKSRAKDGILELYLAHNGGVAKTKLAGLLNVDARSYTDSHLLAMYIASLLEEGRDMVYALRAGYNFVKSGYDVLVLALKDVGGLVHPTLYIAAGVSRRIMNSQESLKYYEPVLVEAPGLAGFVSSTIAEYAIREGLEVNLRIADYGVYEELEGALRKIAEL